MGEVKNESDELLREIALRFQSGEIYSGETPEEAAENYTLAYCSGLEPENDVSEDIFNAFLAACEWCQKNPAALVNWKRKV